MPATCCPTCPAAGRDADLEPDEEDDAEAIPKCVVIDPRFDWEGDRRLRTPWNQTVIYETHVKGFTQLRPGVREDLRGTYAGLADEDALRHLKSLGVTAVELLPVHHIADEHFLADKGLTNYWGYSSIGYFAPHSPYAATGARGQEVREFKGMVKALHRAGIEVILDVVYNHTAEGNHLGPMLCFKGVDNQSYYRLAPSNPRYYTDFTGTGNSLNVVHPSVLRLIMDSLRYWVVECHVDGFRFDLASALARELYEVDRLSAFFDVIHQDPILSQVKLIAEPWDVGPGGYQVGNFPVLWTEWNGIYRDVMRDFWRGEANVGEFARRLTGSSDLYQDDGRRPFASLNFITAHDGFTLRDLVSYNHKHNDANQEGNRDGTDDNRSWNCGAEGETDDPAVNALRERQQRNFLATLLLSQGAPMLLGGDEFARTQGGNNNGWCQDTELSWFDWEIDERGQRQLDFTQRLIALRRAHPVFHRRDFLTGVEPPGGGLPDAWWFRPDGRRMTRQRLERRRAPARVLPQRRGDHGTRRRRRARRGRLVPAALQRLRRGRRLHAAEPPLRQAVGAGVRHVRSRPGGGVADSRRARRAGDRRPLADAAAPHRPVTRSARPTGCSSAASWTSRPRPSWCPTCASSASRTSTSRPHSRRARARRTATTWSTRRASRTRSAASRASARLPPWCGRRAWGSCSTSSRTTWRPMTPTPTGRAIAGSSSSTSIARPAGTGASSTSTTWPECARRIPRSSPRRTGSRWRWSPRGSSTGCASTIPTGSPIPPAICSACATAASSTSGWRRSSIPASSCVTGPSRAPSDTSSRTTSPRCSSTPRARPR